MKHTPFTAEQEQWLRDNFYTAQSYQDLAERFNKAFGTSRSRGQISDKCSKRMKLNGMHNTSKYGVKPKEQLPVGTIRKSQVGTYIKVLKIPPGACFTGYKEPWWMPLQKKLYTDAYGSIPDGYMVCFLDCNPENFSLDNLYPITRQISARLSANGWWSNNPEITKTAIKWCELQGAIKSALTTDSITTPCGGEGG